MADPMTAPRPDLDALERLLEEAQGILPVAWQARADNHGMWRVELANELVCEGCTRAEAYAIAAAINALPALIAAARERDALTDRWCKDGETLAERQQREQAEQTLREAARQNCDECGGTGRIHSHNDICGCVDVPRLLREERQRRESVERREARLRAELREWAEAADKGDLSRILPAEAALRALVAHVEGER